MFSIATSRFAGSVFFLILGSLTSLTAKAENLYSIFDFLDSAAESRYFEANYHRGGENSSSHRAVGPVISGYCRATLAPSRDKGTVVMTLSDFSEKKICPYSFRTRKVVFNRCVSSSDLSGSIFCQADTLLKNRWNQETTDRVVELRVYTQEGPYYGTLLLEMAKVDGSGGPIDALVNEVPLTKDPTF